MKGQKEADTMREGRGEDTTGPLTLTVPQAARQLGVGRNSAYEAIRRGEIPVIKIGKRLLVPKSALAKLLEAAA